MQFKVNKSQKAKLLELLRSNPEQGINSFDSRVVALQLPARIWELKKAGYNIISKTNIDSSVNYILLSTPSKQYKWEFIGDQAIQIEI